MFFLLIICCLIGTNGTQQCVCDNFIYLFYVLTQKVKSEKSECNNSGYKLTGLTWWP